MALITNANEQLRADQLHTNIDNLTAEHLAQLPLSTDELTAFQKTLSGRVVLPSNPEYEKDRRGHCLYPNLAAPKMIVYCESHSDVASCLALAHQKQDVMDFCVRSGGHSNTGYSVCDGMVIDISPLHGVVVMPGLQHAWCGAGAQLHHVYSELHRYQLHVPGGECDTVGVAGHAMGGGYGFTSRMFGLHCDAIDGFRMMLADGRTVLADENTNSDLYWAARGATGNTLGVLLQVRYRTAHLEDLWGFVITWDIDDAAKVLPTLQDQWVRRGAPDNLGYQLAFGPATICGGENQEYLFMMGMVRGEDGISPEALREQGMAMIAPLLEQHGGNLLKDKVAPYEDLNPYLLNWYGVPDMNGLGETKQSNFIDRTLTEDEWQNIIDCYLTKPNGYNMCAFEVYGGIASNPQNPNAYIHRDVDFDMFIDSFSKESWPGSTFEQAEAWLAGFNAVVEQYANGHKYQNYPNRHNDNYRWNYWGDAFNSLMSVKQKYDPDNFFRFEQGLTPYPDHPGILKSDVPSRFKDTPIIYETP